MLQNKSIGTKSLHTKVQKLNCHFYKSLDTKNVFHTNELLI